MAIVNVTPDSFHAASRTPATDAAVEAALRHVDHGADFLDVGGESTRPGATPVDAEEEKARILPVLERLAARTTVPVSVDTYKADVARAAVGAGAVLVNDVSGGLLDPEMASTVAELGVPVVVGHLRGTPATMARAPAYVDVVAEVTAEISRRLDHFVAAGVRRELLLIDPGIGFAKQTEANLELLARLDELGRLERPIVIGLSRKRFLGEVLSRAGQEGSAPEARLEAGLAAAVVAALKGAAVVRTHDVAETHRCLAVVDALFRGG
jgi:dihydropteroate synthase